MEAKLYFIQFETTIIKETHIEHGYRWCTGVFTMGIKWLQKTCKWLCQEGLNIQPYGEEILTPDSIVTVVDISEYGGNYVRENVHYDHYFDFVPHIMNCAEKCSVVYHAAASEMVYGPKIETLRAKLLGYKGVINRKPFNEYDERIPRELLCSNPDGARLLWHDAFERLRYQVSLHEGKQAWMFSGWYKDLEGNYHGWAILIRNISEEDRVQIIKDIKKISHCRSCDRADRPIQKKIAAMNQFAYAVVDDIYDYYEYKVKESIFGKVN